MIEEERDDRREASNGGDMRYERCDGRAITIKQERQRQHRGSSKKRTTRHIHRQTGRQRELIMGEGERCTDKPRQRYVDIRRHRERQIEGMIDNDTRAVYIADGTHKQRMHSHA